MMRKKKIMGYSQKSRGFTYVELLVTIAIVALVFGGLFGSFQLLLGMIGKSKAKAGATALATESLEYIRSLPYDDIGTISGVPPGNIPQNKTVTLNGVTYDERVLIVYIDDPADGTGGSDSNSILADYKQVKIEYTWTVRGDTDSLSLVSNVVPIGIETTAGGGTIKVNVFDAAVLPVENATVRFVNDSLSPTIDTTRFTDSNGAAYLSGAPAGANYQIEVTKAGYSFDGTYVATSSNPNPVTPPIAVATSTVSTMNFQIDVTSDLLVKTLDVATIDTFVDDFDDTSLIGTSNMIDIIGGVAQLSESGPGVYETSGTLMSTSTKPATIQNWNYAALNVNTTAQTSVSVSVYYDNGGALVLIPDGDLPGNSSGFLVPFIDLSALDAGVYDELALGATLATTDTAQTPSIDRWTLEYTTAQSPEPNVSLSISGSKSIGTDAGGQPVLKFNTTTATDGSGEVFLNDLEWDLYSISVLSAGYDVLEICGPTPYSLIPGVVDEMTIVLDTASGNILRTTVQETDGTPIPLATVRLQNPSVDETHTTSLCGQTFFGGLPSASDYTVTVSASGYVTEIRNNVAVTATSTEEFILNP